MKTLTLSTWYERFQRRGTPHVELPLSDGEALADGLLVVAQHVGATAHLVAVKSE